MATIFNSASRNEPAKGKNPDWCAQPTLLFKPHPARFPFFRPPFVASDSFTANDTFRHARIARTCALNPN